MSVSNSCSSIASPEVMFEYRVQKVWEACEAFSGKGSLHMKKTINKTSGASTVQVCWSCHDAPRPFNSLKPLGTLIRRKRNVPSNLCNTSKLLAVCLISYLTFVFIIYCHLKLQFHSLGYIPKDSGEDFHLSLPPKDYPAACNVIGSKGRPSHGTKRPGHLLVTFSRHAALISNW